MTFLGKNNSTIHKALSGKTAGSSSFNTAWKNMAKKYPKEFQQVQHDFIKASHYSPAASKIKANTGLDVNTRSVALQSAVWSMSTQHGAGGASSIFKNAGIKPGMSDKDIITRIYNERMKVNKYFSKSSAAVKKGVYNRFVRELKDALAMLGK